MKTLREGWRWLNDAPRHRRGARILQVAVGVLIWFRVVTEFQYAEYFWGPNGLGHGNTERLFGVWVSHHVDMVFRTTGGTSALLAGLGAAALCLIFGVTTRWASLVALLLSLCLEARLPELLDGGDNVARIVLIYMCFLIPPGQQRARNSASVYLHNLAVVAIVLQVCVVYLTSGFMKANGTRWSQGTALYLVSQVEWFSLPSTRGVFRNPFIITLMSYGTIFFQLWFPIALISHAKLLWVVAGVTIHCCIAVTMGLIPFSTIMIGLELFLVSDEEWARAIAHVAGWRERVIGAVRTSKLRGATGGAAQVATPTVADS